VKLALIDYGAGNLASVRKGFAAAGSEPVTPGSPSDLEDVSGIIVPGVGHFSATRTLDEPWREAILRRIDNGVPLFGICLGMQWLFDGSTECSSIPGLALFAGTCSRINADRPLKVPHVGWNRLSVRNGSRLFDGIGDASYVYFTHAFAAPVTDECSATTTHGVTFAAAVEREHLWGVQFHPEKSSSAGLQVLRNFIKLTRS
jgi:glutamine amidotransferase